MNIEYITTLKNAMADREKALEMLKKAEDHIQMVAALITKEKFEASKSKTV